MTRAQQLANAYLWVAQINHHMLGIVAPVTLDELVEAEQILISNDNATDNKDSTVNLALDLIEHAIEKARCDA